MSPTTMAFIMIIIVIAAILWNKIPMNFIMFLVPLICALVMGYSIPEVSGVILDQISNVMKSAGYMLMFGLIFFTMLSETGMFDIIIGRFVNLIGDKINVVVVMVMTAVIAAIGYLTANMSTTYLIVFPIMIPMFKRFKLDQRWAFILAQTALCAMCWLPWGIGVVNSAMMAGVSPEELATASIPWGLTFVPGIIAEIIFFTIMHKKKYGTLGPQIEGVEAGQKADPLAGKENAKPQFFWINFIIFALAVIALAVLKYPSYLVFIVGCIAVSLINYPKDFGKIWNKAGMTFFNVLVMLLGICFYLAVFNMTRFTGPDGASVVALGMPGEGFEVAVPSMVNSLASFLTGIFPQFLMKNMYLIFLLLVVPIIFFVPYQVYNAMYPLFISIGASFGIAPIAIIAPFVCNLAAATSNTPMNSATYVGCSLCEVEDVKGYCVYAGVIMFFVNLLSMVLGIVFGLVHL